MTMPGSSILQALALDYEAAVRASQAHNGPDAEFDQVIDQECAIARHIVFTPAATLDDLSIKAVVALRETGTNKFVVADRIDCDALIKAFDDQERPCLAELINVSIFLDIMRLAGKASDSRATYISSNRKRGPRRSNCHARQRRAAGRFD